ncbi:MAG: PEP-CTERM sorting domain-containing protein [Phycisphaerales bacterium]|nr:PEP-CTERM sorting domain-containing protein [Phycisphaerales bacterium]
MALDSISVPAPTSISLLGLTGLAAARRRRRA